MGDGPFLPHPRFGFSEQQMIDTLLSNATLASALTERVAGTRFAAMIGVFVLTGGAGIVRLFLEGSNDDVNWETISFVNFVTTAKKVVNSGGNSLVDMQRFKSIRTRAAITGGAPVFTLQTIVTAISRDAESFLLTETFGRSAALPISQYGALFPRPAGTLLATLQVVAAGVVLNGAASFNAVLQGSPDDGTTWVTIATAAVTGNGSELALASSESLFSLGQYANLRFGVEDDGVAGAAAAFSIELLLGIDSSDWIVDGDGTSGSAFDPNEVFCSVTFDVPTAEALNTRTVSFQIVDSDGVPIAEARKVELILYDTSNAGDADLANNATFSVVNTGAGITPVGTNRFVMTTDATGAGDVSVLDASAETVYLTAVNNRGPSTIPQVIVKSEQAILIFA